MNDAGYLRLLAEVLETLQDLAADWEYSRPLTPATTFFGDLGFESLDLVVLGAALQRRYGRLPFAEFLATLGQQGRQDITVGDLVAFIRQHVAQGA
jgi:acyl carrier protein